MQCSPLIPGTTRTTIEQAFLQTEGIDIDANASAATKLSLALLHLVATGTLPVDLPIRTADAISEALEQRIGRYSYGAVLSNPPYIKHEHLGDETRENLKLLLGDDFVGRVDTYLGFVKLALNATEPNGFVCLVLPQVFLQSNNGAPLRMQIAEEFDVRCLVDLSSMPIFEGVGAYSILLIAQRRRVNGIAETKAQVAIVTDFAGAALQACIDGRNVETPFHSVFSVAQEFFQTKQWTLLGPAHLLVSERLSELPRLSDYADVSQGIVTGADDIFIRPLWSIPAKEAAAYVSYLPDRQIARFRLPPRTDMVVFYPFKEKTPLTEEEVQKLYPKTWQYLEDNRAALSNRGPVKNGNTPWWRPERPREPKKVRAPKIVCPHLMLTPRFALDETGQYAVSRAPFIVAKEQVTDKQLLRLLSAVLNSSVCNWYLRTYSPKYAKGYSRVEIGLLKSLPVPDLAGFDAAVINRMLGLISRIKDGKNVGSAELELDTIVASLYGFSADERKKLLGIEE